VREFEVVAGREADFERVFGRDGIWSEFLKLSPRYLGSSIRLEVDRRGRRYKVLDEWRSHEDFEAFRQEQQAGVERFKAFLAAEGLVERETVLGSFYQDDSDWDEDAGLISA